jgi:two-component system OmpR family sensor kinase
MSLRLRLMLAISGFVLVGLLIAGGVTYFMLRSFLLERLDEQLVFARGPVVHQLVEGNTPPPPADQPSSDQAPLVPPGTVGEVVDGGNIVGQPAHFDYGQSPNPLPALPDPIGAPPAGRTFTTGAVGDPSFHYRVLAQALPNGGVLVVAIPQSDVIQTLSRLLTIEALVALGVLLGLGALSYWMVRRELRPLGRIEETAGAIAAGDLSRRVDTADPRTEVGRLGVSLNAMLQQIEQAFAERKASEDRLRRFLADASHELRTPLTSIRGYSELFRRGASVRPDDLATSMRRIEEEAARMGVLVDELLVLARLDQGRPLDHAPVDLVRIAEDAVADARAVDPTREITIEVPAMEMLTGDEARLREVAANLLANALAHTPPGTPVEVRVDDDGPNVVLRVSDSGSGLSAEERTHVFEPFYRSDPSRERGSGGAGLGLSIVAAIVAAHGGNVTALPSDGTGATFRVLLPKDRAEVEDHGSQEGFPVIA